MKEWYGYTGRILRVDLSKGKVVVDELKDDWPKLYVGGLGFAARIMWDEFTPLTDPLSPESILIGTAGPMTGTLAPGSGNIFWAFKSPLTNFWGETRSGGKFGAFLKFSGFDVIIIKGKSQEPVYLYLEGGKAEIRKADHLWEMTVHQATDTIKEEVGAKDISVTTIGPAGENLVRYASIINDYDRAAGRTGGGAVMGSKKLKAIVAAGGYGVRVYDPERFLSLSYEAEKAIISDAGNKGMGAHGTIGGLSLLNTVGGLPTQNFRTGYFENADKISGDYLERNYMIKRRACYSCTIGCSRYSYVAAGKYATPPNEGPEYETADMSGAMLMNGNMESIIRFNYLANNYGIDTISLGHTISWAIEAYELGMLTDEDTNGIKLRWGDPDIMLKLVNMIAYRQGIGDLLAEGSYAASKKIGKGSEEIVNHVKGLEFPAHDPRVESKFLAIQYAVGPRGACHIHPIYPSYDMMGVDSGLRAVGLPWPLPDRLDETGVNRGKAYRVIALYGEVLNSLGYCNFYVQSKEDGSLSPKRLSALYSSLTGIELTPMQIFEAGERSWNLKRAFNIREGLNRKHDTLPKRVKMPVMTGPAKGLKVENPDGMVDETYEAFGWEKQSGYIKEETLRRLDLDDVAEYLKNVKKLA
ncbi:MAG: aldehyde ferredoxin oxidoreductase family protein [Caldisphaera sp.]|jgi:aldehyde:ferredoxin oxidoreductase|nr:aldehyde ferredoxin oxidoreductase family protein [Caldisphaera sp.]PMP60805.1 MAG: aldehyde ferredoxin oxidoreductase [Caldisphaera sp.]PMP92262.1 MAG: aldehyde ferredoxin oxidoreductase [Caldisphaera sp.]